MNDSLNETLKYMTLNFTPGLGVIRINLLLTHFGSIDNIYNQDSQTLAKFVKPEIANLIVKRHGLELAQRELDWINSKPYRYVVHHNHPLYPQNLTHIATPPVILYLEGRIELLNNPKFAIVGTRTPTPQGQANATKFAKELSQQGLTIISGMANGIDRYAHLGAIDSEASTIGVIGTGLDGSYPTANKDIYAKMRTLGLLVSEYPIGTSPLAQNFPRRNRIVAGMSLGCLIVESTLDGGSMISANYAMEMGREVMAIPGSIHSPFYRGCHKLIKDGAKLIETTSDILEELNLHFNLFENVQLVDNDPILQAIGVEPIEIDQICAIANLEFAEICARLLELELNGVIKNCGKGKYQRIIN